MLLICRSRADLLYGISYIQEVINLFKKPLTFVKLFILCALCVIKHLSFLLFRVRLWFLRRSITEFLCFSLNVYLGGGGDPILSKPNIL